ncbi:MAG TPA: electron transport complex subunit E [Clostridiales bacterium]|nr:electron transport complex subunit E [Clostridiales bacterium]HQP69976.1 electron transport complex subunit E [Clostridiales bacterium]
MEFKKNLTKGFFKDNPVLVLGLGLCATLAVTTNMINALGMGAATTFVLIGSSVLVSALKKVTPNDIRIPIFVVMIATFVTIVDLSMKAWMPALSSSLGIFIPLIVVNCIILGRAEAFAFKNSIWDSAVDAFGMGIGFTIALSLMSGFREILGSGTFFGFPLFGSAYKGPLMMILPPGGFLMLGLILAFINWNRIRKSKGNGGSK